MKINIKRINWKTAGIISGFVLAGIYVLFLILPFAISPIVNSFSDDISRTVKEITGLDLRTEKLGIYTTPLFSVGLKADEIVLKIPEKAEAALSFEKTSVDLKLLPLLFKKVQLGKISANNVNVNLVVKNDGGFEILDYIPQKEEEQEPISSLPYGLKLSNHLPDFKIKNYRISFENAQNGKLYYIDGINLNISDFILDKCVKLSTEGRVIFDDMVVSNYDIVLDNNIMPKLLLDDLVFPKDVKIEEEKSVNAAKNSISFNIIDVFDAVIKNQFKADLNMNVKTSGTFKNPVQNGLFEIYNMSVAVKDEVLPVSYAKLIFKGKKTDIDSILYTSNDKDEQTHIIGNITSGEKANIDLTFRSNAKFNNIIRLIDSVAQSFNINDFKTLSATGEIDADFNINSDLKMISSAGHIKINPSSIKYGLYNLSVDNINADIDLMHDNIDIKNAGFSVMGHPLSLKGTISSDAYADLNLTADKLSLKGLLLTAGQLSLLKENDINSGTISLNAVIRGLLAELNPDIKINADNINIYNKPSKSRVKLTNALIKVLYEDKKLSGDIDINSLGIKLDGASVSVPKAKVVMDTKDINISNTYLLLNNSRIDIKGAVKDYLNENLNINISAAGNIAARDIMAFVPKEFHSMFPYKGSMPVKFTVTGDSKIQNVSFDLSADSNGYVRFLNIDKLRGKTTKIHSDIKISGDSLKFDNSGIYAGSQSIATFNGGVTNLANPHLNINVSVPENISFTIPGMNEHSNITANGNANIGGTLDDPKLKGKVNIADISMTDMKFALTNLVAHLNGQGISGNGTAEKMVFDGIVASDISAKFSLKNYTDFYLEDIIADCFGGKVNGKLSYNIPHFAFAIDLTGKGLNSMDAVYGAVGIPKALTGTMGFNAKLTGKGVTDIEIIKSLKGNINFNVNDGRFVSIGKWENLVAAQNVTSNSVLKSAIGAMSTVKALQETDRFKSITGDLTMSDGTAKLNKIFVSGPLMSYYVTGLYYILNNTANLTILGRLDSKIVSYLGPLGQLSVSKLVSYIPGFGAATAKMLDLLTVPPKEEELALIPALSNGSKEYRDFKTIFNGQIDKASSVKSFRWLSVCDTTKMNLAQDGKDAVQAAKDNINSQLESAKNTAENVKNNVYNIVNTQKQNIETQKKSIEQTKEDLKNIKQNAGQTVNNLGNLFKNAAQNATKKMDTGTEKPQEVTVEKTESKTSDSEISEQINNATGTPNSNPMEIKTDISE